MKVFALVLVASTLSCLDCNGQVETVKPDTLKSYSTLGAFKGYAVSGDSTISFNYGENRANEKRKLTSEEYGRFKLGRKNFETCKPCWLKTFDIFTDKLLYEGLQYTDARVGKFKVYYGSGRVKEEGRYTFRETNTRIGIWIYYDEEGKIEERKDFGN